MEKNSRPKYHIVILLAPSPLGWFGAHKYYVGKKKSAILYAIFAITFITPLLAVLDSFILMYKGKESFLEKYGTEEDITKHHLNEVLRRSPEAVSPKFKSKLVEADDLSEVLDLEDEDENMEKLIEEIRNSKDKSHKTEEKEDEEDPRIDRPDYDEYYGDW